MMKQLGGIALIILALASLAPGQKTQTREHDLKKALIELETKSWEAWKNCDGKFFPQFLSDDHVEVGFGGVELRN